jgi:hypothetical protein
VAGTHEPITPLVSSAEQTRQVLTAFEQQLPDLRRHLLASNGWFEVFYVPKRRYKEMLLEYAKALGYAREHSLPLSLVEAPPALHPDVARLLRAGIPPKDMSKELRDQIYNITGQGPYMRYRWREGKHLSTISLGLLDDYPPRPFTPAGF